MHRIVRAIQIEQDARRDAMTLALAQVEADQRNGQAITGLGIDRILQPGQRRLAGQRCPTDRQLSADMLEQWIVAQGGGVILILVAAGNLVQSLLDQRL